MIPAKYKQESNKENSVLLKNNDQNRFRERIILIEFLLPTNFALHVIV